MDTVLLFDIDGTLLVSVRGKGYRGEIARALERVFGTSGTIGETRFDGKTDLAILREALAPDGVTYEAIVERLPEWQAAFLELNARLAVESPLFVRCPGVGEVLAAVESDERYVLSVLTGNLEATAGAKLEAVGLGHHFRLRGAYGSDHHDRNELPAIAAGRIVEQTGRAYEPPDFVIVGDTPRDIEAARTFGMRCVAVATGHFNVEQLAVYGPDALLPDLADVDAFLGALAGL
ncbi:MAG TPA: haloacid dehalogenase-like hydrolase [Blastocatellia bacterium]|nr:haloacid dehalogenase-like hydrolase [Blastocatellia bacterium]